MGLWGHCRRDCSDPLQVTLLRRTKDPLAPCPYGARCNGCASEEKRQTQTQHTALSQRSTGTCKDSDGGTGNMTHKRGLRVYPAYSMPPWHHMVSICHHIWCHSSLHSKSPPSPLWHQPLQWNHWLASGLHPCKLQ